MKSKINNPRITDSKQSDKEVFDTLETKIETPRKKNNPEIDLDKLAWGVMKKELTNKSYSIGRGLEYGLFRIPEGFVMEEHEYPKGIPKEGESACAWSFFAGLGSTAIAGMLYLGFGLGYLVQHPNTANWIKEGYWLSIPAVHLTSNLISGIKAWHTVEKKKLAKKYGKKEN